MDAAKSTQGRILSMGVQSNFYTAETGTTYDVVTEGEPTVATPTPDAVTPAPLFADPNEVAKPVLFNAPVDGAVSYSTLIRTVGASPSQPSLDHIFKSGGYGVAHLTNTTIAAYTSTTVFTLTDAAAGVGYFIGVTGSNGMVYPTLLADYVSGTKTCTPAMALPAAAANGNAVVGCMTVTPGDAAEVSEYLTYIYTTRAINDGGILQAVAKGCALTAVGDIDVTPGTLPALQLTFGAADVSSSSVASMPDNDFWDASAVQVTDNPIVQFANASDAGAIAATYGKLIKATIQFGKTAERITGFGDTTCVNGVQGFMGKNAPCEVTLEVVFDEAMFELWDAGTNTSKHIAIIQPSSSSVTDIPAWAFVTPNAHIMEKASIDYGENAVKLTLKYTGNPAGYNSTTLPTEQGNQPWYFGVATGSY